MNQYSNAFKIIKVTPVNPRKIVTRTNVEFHRDPSSLRTARAIPPRVARRFHGEHERSFVRSFDSFARIPGNVRARVVYIRLNSVRNRSFFLKSHSGRGDIGKSRGDVSGVYVRAV